MRHYASDPNYRGYTPDHGRLVILHDGDPVSDWLHAQIDHDGSGFVVFYERDANGIMILQPHPEERREAMPTKSVIHVDGIEHTLRVVRDTLQDDRIITDVAIEVGKYRYVQSDRGSTLYRFGKPWRDSTGDGCMLAFAQTVAYTREQLNARHRIETVHTVQVGDLSDTKHCITHDATAQEHSDVLRAAGIVTNEDGAVRESGLARRLDRL